MVGRDQYGEDAKGQRYVIFIANRSFDAVLIAIGETIGRHVDFGCLHDSALKYLTILLFINPLTPLGFSPKTGNYSDDNPLSTIRKTVPLSSSPP